MMLHTRDPLDAHIANVDALTGAGIRPPAAWLALREQLHAAPAETMLDRYIAAVIAADPGADLAALKAGALAEAIAGPPHHAEVRNGLRAAAGRKLCALYAPVAEANYTTVANRFDDAAAKLTKAMAVVDPDADPGAIVTADAKTRTAWADAAIAAADLDRLTPVLQAGGDLCGVATAKAEQIFALTVDADEVHRRTAWEAFNTSGGRCGRWAALVAAGARIRAQQPIAALQPYRQAKPLEERWEQISRGQLRRKIVDPEDEQPTAASV